MFEKKYNKMLGIKKEESSLLENDSVLKTTL